MAKSGESTPRMAVLCTLLLVFLSCVKSEELEENGSASGEEPSKTSHLCDDEDYKCDPEIIKASRTTTPTLHTKTPKTKHLTTPSISTISWTPSNNHLKTVATTKPSLPMFTIGQPRFHGDSFMALPRLPWSARKSLELSITFKANDQDGLLLYSGRQSKKEDFLAVGLVDGFVELRFSNGADTVTLKTPNNVTLGTWHKVVVFRDQRDGYLTLDYGQLVSGSSNKNKNLMNLNTRLYVGGLPRFNVKSIPFGHGLYGCVKEVVVDGKKMDLRLPGGEAKQGYNIDECKKVIKICQCKNGGNCQYSSKGHSLCACPLGTAGQLCEHEVTLKIPSFNGHSFLSYPSTGDVASKTFTISLTLKPSGETGLILLNADRAKRKGDFFSLSLREGMVEFLFDCGSGAAIIRSREPISIDHWHTITIWRSGSKGRLTVDDGLPVYGESPGRLRHISLRQNLYLGGMRDYKHQPYEIDMRSGFVGCIQKVVINFSPLDLTSPLSGVNVENCDHVCVTQPICQNGGTCHADMDSFQCQCSVGYTGMLCNKRLDIKMPSFSGRSYLSYPSLGGKAYKAFTIVLILKPRQDTGLILYNNQRIDGKGDFVSLALREGFVEFVFDCGSGAAKLRSTSKIMVDQWHTITISRTGKKGKLMLDDGIPVFGESPGRFRYVTLKSDLFLGGMKDYAQQPLTNAVRMGFVGCIQTVTVNTKPLVLSSPRSGVNAHNCDHVCVMQYVCMNGGTCHAEMDNFKCRCATGYTGMMCDRAIRLYTHHFDGNTFVTITKKKIMKRISGSTTNVQMQVKTKSSKGLLVFAHQHKSLSKTYFMIILNDGFIEVRYRKSSEEERILIRSKRRVNDDQWHKLDVTRTSSAWTVQVDDSKTDESLKHKDFFDFYRGEMFVGGLPDHVVYWPNLEGSIRGLVIGGYNVDVTAESLVSVQARRYRISDIKYSFKQSFS